MRPQPPIECSVPGCDFVAQAEMLTSDQIKLLAIHTTANHLPSSTGLTTSVLSMLERIVSSVETLSSDRVSINEPGEEGNLMIFNL